MKQIKQHTSPLKFYIILITFISTAVTPMLIGWIFLLISNWSGDYGPSPYFPLFTMLVESLLAGIVLTLLVNRLLLSPLVSFSDAIKKVATGDFSVRVKTDYSFPELGQLAGHFNKMVQELGSIESLRNDFAANISHEFRTPLAAIEGYTTLLQDHSLTEKERNEYIHIIIDSVRQLSSLSGNILAMSRLEKQEIVTNKTRYCLDEQLRQAILLLEPLWDEKKLDLDIDMETAWYYGNADMIMQVWVNLLHNAIQYTPKNGTIRVYLKNEGSLIRVSIQDTGIGMDEATIAHIFDKFFRKDKNSSSGNGLGLPMVKRILELSHGSITVESRPDEGSSFTVTLPVEAPAD